MRTTLKRGLGRAAPNGNGKPVLPPGVTSPVSLYRQEAYGRSRMGRIGRVLAWLGIVALVFMVGSAGGAYLYFHESVAAVAAKTPAVKKAAKQLDIPLPGQPAVALVIGSDHRVAEGKGAASRSDTLMLLRADPQTDSISLLSFPRDMRVEIHCPGRTPYFDKIAHAYATCGPRGSLQTVKNLTNLDINYLITVDFLGFIDIVDRLGGAWIDVDRRYFNDRSGPSGYARIDLRPGYQNLTGRQALAYARFRHTDSDLYRVARQQQFVKAIKGQIQDSFGPTALPKIVHAITSNVEVAQGGGNDVSGKTVLSYAFFAYGLPRGHVFQTRIDGLEGFTDLTTDSSNITRAVQTFTHPDVQSSEKATAVALGRKLKRTAPAARDTTITVLNGNGRTGSATSAGAQLDDRGYRILTPPNGLPANAPSFTYFRTQVYFRPSVRGAREAAAKVGNLFGSAEVKRLPADIASTRERGHAHDRRRTDVPRDARVRPDRPDAEAREAERRVGRERRARPAARAPEARPFPTDAPDGDRAELLDVRRRARAALLDRRRAQAQGAPAGLPNCVERVLGRPDDRLGRRSRPERQKPHAPHRKARVRPLLQRPEAPHGRANTSKGRYWVVNTLLDRLSNETMIAIAKGLRPLGRAR